MLSHLTLLIWIRSLYYTRLLFRVSKGSSESSSVSSNIPALLVKWLINRIIAAYFVQSVVSSYERHLATSSSVPTDGMGKECSNLIVLISELYNFQVTSCILVYDIIRDLLAKELSELNVELLLKILRSESPEFAPFLADGGLDSGQQLRQDDPAALKDIIQVVQGKTPTTESSSRYCNQQLCGLLSNQSASQLKNAIHDRNVN